MPTKAKTAKPVEARDGIVAVHLFKDAIVFNRPKDVTDSEWEAYARDLAEAIEAAAQVVAVRRAIKGLIGGAAPGKKTKTHSGESIN